MPKAALLYTLLGLGGITAVTLTGVAIGGGFSSRKIAKVVDPKDRVYTWDCYKWIVDMQTQGEVWACYDMRKTEVSSRPLIFVLWWLPQNKADGWNTFTEIEQIKLEEDKKTLSFVFTSGQDKFGERKLRSPRGLYWMKKSGDGVEKQPQLDWSKISGKPLKENCKLQGNKLACESYQNFQAEQERLATSPRFKLIY